MPRLAVSAARTVNRGTCRLGFGGLTDQFLPFELADWSVRVHGTSCQGGRDVGNTCTITDAGTSLSLAESARAKVGIGRNSHHQDKASKPPWETQERGNPQRCGQGMLSTR